MEKPLAVASRPITTIPKTSTAKKANAGMIALVRNIEYLQMLTTVQNIESQFNKKYEYPYLFFNQEPFNDQFKTGMTDLLGNRAIFFHLGDKYWDVPSWINKTIQENCMGFMKDEGVKFGNVVSYHQMSRWFSGFFFKHPAIASMEFYWRIEPGAKYFCQFNYDPFMYLKENDKSYGFTIMPYEAPNSIPSLWSATKTFIQLQSLPISPLLSFFINENGTYNGCHFWSSFEIARVDLWNNQIFKNYFDFLDNLGGFFYEQWRDAPVHSLFIGMTLRKDQVHHFNDIGYSQSPYQHCSTEGDLANICKCNDSDGIRLNTPKGCISKWCDYNEKEWK